MVRFSDYSMVIRNRSLSGACPGGWRMVVAGSSRCAAPALRYGPAGDPPQSMRPSAAMAVSELTATGRSLDAHAPTMPWPRWVSLVPVPVRRCARPNRRVAAHSGPRVAALELESRAASESGRVGRFSPHAASSIPPGRGAGLVSCGPLRMLTDKLARRVGLRAGPGQGAFGAVRVDAAVGAALMRALEWVSRRRWRH